MLMLYHLWLSPVSRAVRVIAAEKGIPIQLRVEPIWERRPEFLALNPAGDVPVLVNDDGLAVSGGAIAEYLDETVPVPPLIGEDALDRAEVRRLVAWFDGKFESEVTDNLVGEKVMKRFLGLGEPDSAAIRAGHANIRTHLDYIAFLTERRTWLAGEQMTLADIAASTQISCVDYVGDVPWADHEAAKDWYVRIKSRPSFRPLLADTIPGLAPSKIYADLDF